MAEHTLELLILIYGGVAGWLGLAFAFYLSRIRPYPAHPAAVLGVFAMGFTMVMGTILVGDLLDPFGRYASFVGLMAAYTLMLVAEVALVVAHTHPHVFIDVHEWAAKYPRFAHRYQLRKAAGESPDTGDGDAETAADDNFDQAHNTEK